MGRGKLIMVIDDQKAMRFLLEAVLIHHGYRVVLAGNGPQALDLVAQEQPDLILLDMNMPGMSGPETLAALRQRWPVLPVIMVTAAEAGVNWDKVEKLGVQGRVNKPFDIDDLARIVAEVLPY